MPKKTSLPKKNKKIRLPSWNSVFVQYFKRRLLFVFLMGFSSGLPLLLTLSTLTWWLKGEGISKTTIGIFTLTTLPYSWKFLWAPLLDRLNFPFLSKKLGRRRSWILLSQIATALSIIFMGQINPQENLFHLAILSILVTFWSATQDVVIDAYRIDILNQKEMTAGGASEVVGYRIAMMVSGAGAIALSDFMHWDTIYLIMGVIMLSCSLITFFCPAPHTQEARQKTSSQSYSKWLIETYSAPLKDFFKRKDPLMILAFILLYHLGENLIGPMSMIFYKELGFTGVEVASATKLFGAWMTILGTILIGGIALKYGILRTLLISGIIHIIANGFFFILAHVGHNLPVLYFSMVFENISGGMMKGALVGYLSGLCTKSFSATQYALLSSIMAQGRILTYAISGWIADQTSWPVFFSLATIAAVPGLLIILRLMKSSDQS